MQSITKLICIIAFVCFQLISGVVLACVQLLINGILQLPTGFVYAFSPERSLGLDIGFLGWGICVGVLIWIAGFFFYKWLNGHKQQWPIPLAQSTTAFALVSLNWWEVGILDIFWFGLGTIPGFVIVVQRIWACQRMLRRGAQ